VTFAETRAMFPVLERVAYLNAGTFGPLASATAEAMAEQARRDLEEGRGGGPYIDAMLALRMTARERVAALIGTTAEHISLTPSTTTGCNIVLAGLGLTPDDDIVTTDAEHFGLAGPVFASGARVRVAAVQDKPPDDALDAILAEVTPRTKVLAVSHVLWTTGAVLPVAELKDRTGLPIIVDGAQSAGAIPVDVGELDYYTVSGQKWLCGPESTGALYVADVDALRIAAPSYFAQESFVPGGEYVVRAGAQRFDSGWTPVAALAGMITALDLAPDWRFARVAELAERCRELLAERAEVVTAPDQAGLVTFAPNGDPEETVARLHDQGVMVRSVPGTPWVRASTGWWNDERDLERLVASLI
jgi:L-cysteine/cystine lyase